MESLMELLDILPCLIPAYNKGEVKGKRVKSWRLLAMPREDRDGRRLF